MTVATDVLIIGGGIAAASVGYFLAPHAKVTLLEMESQPGYHSTGRSAALFMESYGTDQVRALTRASRAFLESPPPGFSDFPVLSTRGAMLLATPGEENVLEAEWAMMRGASAQGRLLDRQDALALLPVLRPEMVLGAVFEPDASDMDVHSIHQGYLRGLRRAGGTLVCNAQAQQIQRVNGLWRVHAAGQWYTAPILVNAAGAWADVVALRAGVRPLGLQPRRRSAFTFAPPSGLDCARWPLTAGMDESWYIKPDAGMLLGSPANVDPVEPHDVQAEEIDIAKAIHRIQEMTTLTVTRPTRTWAGLRSFVADGDLVGGYDSQEQGFFWLAAQGGYGIQTSAAMGETCAALVLAKPMPERLADFGISAAILSPARASLQNQTKAQV